MFLDTFKFHLKIFTIFSQKTNVWSLSDFSVSEQFLTFFFIFIENCFTRDDKKSRPTIKNDTFWFSRPILLRWKNHSLFRNKYHLISTWPNLLTVLILRRLLSPKFLTLKYFKTIRYPSFLPPSHLWLDPKSSIQRISGAFEGFTNFGTNFDKEFSAIELFRYVPPAQMALNVGVIP